MIKVMTRRLLALTMVAVVAGAPEALEACQVICAIVTPTESSTAASSVAFHHSHHQEAVPSGGPALQPVSNACGSDEALLPSAARQSARFTVQPANAAIVHAFALVRQSTRPFAPLFHQKPPGVVLLAAPLRI
jgi:hypothetical protein